MSPPEDFPKPSNELELRAYRMHLLARFLDDVKSSTPQLVRSIVFMWLVMLGGVAGMGMLLLLTLAADALPINGSWILGAGALGTVSIVVRGSRRARRSRPPKKAQDE
jgi:hypothetical protein